MEFIPGFCAGFICMQKRASRLCSQDEFHSNRLPVNLLKFRNCHS